MAVARAAPSWTRSGRRWRPASASTSRTASHCSSPTTCSRSASSPTSHGGARRRRRGLLRPEPLSLPDQRLPGEVQVLRLRGDAEAGHAYTLTPDEFVADALAAARGDAVHRDPHGQRREPARGLRLLPRHDRGASRGASGRPPQVLHGVRDPPHDDALGLTHEEVLHELQDAGLGSLPGGGAEVFADRVRRLVAPGKEHPDAWFHVHDTAHRLGIPTHCTMLYGHVETYEERDRPLAPPPRAAGPDGRLPRVHPAGLPPGEHGLRAAWLELHDRRRGSEDDRGLTADARQLPNIKAYWIMMGMPLAQVALHFGANDVQGTVVREEIFQAAGRQRAPSRRSTSSSASSATPGESPCSATRSTTSCGGGDQPQR